MSKISEHHIKRLTENDWQAWKEIRLEALKLHPEAFGASYEDEKNNPDDEFIKTLKKKTVFGAFGDNNLVGVAGFFTSSGAKTQHRGTMFGMYVKDTARGTGIADKLVKTVINHAKTVVEQLHCTVVTVNPAALKLYRKHGFEVYGTEPHSLKTENLYYDEHLMVIMFRK